MWRQTNWPIVGGRALRTFKKKEILTSLLLHAPLMFIGVSDFHLMRHSSGLGRGGRGGRWGGGGEGGERGGDLACKQRKRRRYLLLFLCLHAKSPPLSPPSPPPPHLPPLPPLPSPDECRIRWKSLTPINIKGAWSSNEVRISFFLKVLRARPPTIGQLVWRHIR